MLTATFLPYWAQKNPYMARLAAALRNTGVRLHPPQSSLRTLLTLLWGPRVDVVHLHWLHWLTTGTHPLSYGPRCFLAYCVYLRLRWSQTALVCTVHNLYDHEARTRARTRRLARFLYRRAHALIVHGAAAADEVRRFVEPCIGAPPYLIPHPHFIDDYPSPLPRAQARAELGLDANVVFACVGRIEAYKGIEDLLDSFLELACDRATLLIAGEVGDRRVHAAILAQAQACSNIEYYPGYASADELSRYIAASDAVIGNYRDTFTSGTAVLAMSLARAFIGPRLPALVELLGPRQGELLYEPGDRGALTQTLAIAVDQPRQLSEWGRGNRCDIARRNWGSAGRTTRAVYQAAVRRAQGASSQGPPTEIT